MAVIMKRDINGEEKKENRGGDGDGRREAV